ncbi:MAG: 4Fe-4S dicluster domain-containing protein [Candidatus Methanofastidiosia archaeon]|jgi:CO dehydrogenase/acetyl-CoA synthase alpha subunit
MAEKEQVQVQKEEIEEKDQEDVPKTIMVTVYIMGKEYEVPQGLTIMKAMEYAGYRLIRGAGCRAGFCGACGTIFRLKDEYKFRTALACQTTVEDGMYLTQLPFVPATKAEYDIEELRAQPNVIVSLYPEIARCVSCNTCTKACPQDLEVMDFIQAALRGDIEQAARESFDCLQCGMCAARCPADIVHYHVGQLARRLYGKYVAPRSEHLEKRNAEIEAKKFDDEMDELTQMELDELKKVYTERDTE